MEDKKKEETTEEAQENDLKWEKSYRLATADNMIPILKSLLLVVEEQKKLTMKKAEDAKALLAAMKERRK